MAKMLSSNALSVLCEGIAMMLSAGIQVEEAVDLISDNKQDPYYKQVCKATYTHIVNNGPLSDAMRSVGAFPDYTIDMVAAGEQSGRLENVLHNLAQYYSEEDRLFKKMRNALAYPAALLAIMSVILLFTVVAILPVFFSVYESIAGTLVSSSYAFVSASSLIGQISLLILLICTIIVLLGFRMSKTNRPGLVRILERFPLTRNAMYQLALARFTTILATYVSCGIDSDLAMEKATHMIDHKELKKKADAAYQEMIDPKKGYSLSQAINNNELFEPIYARMLIVGSRSGSAEETLTELGGIFFDEAVIHLDGLIDSIEPALAAFLTVSVGATLISVMLPLVGIMSSIG